MGISLVQLWNHKLKISWVQVPLSLQKDKNVRLKISKMPIFKSFMILVL